jgi:hypothetical protein
MLGAGGSGLVALAYDKVTKQTVAIKFVQAQPRVRDFLSSLGCQGLTGCLKGTLLPPSVDNLTCHGGDVLSFLTFSLCVVLEDAWGPHQQTTLK